MLFLRPLRRSGRSPLDCATSTRRMTFTLTFIVYVSAFPSIIIINFDAWQGNILVDVEGHVRLTDFGRAKVIGDPSYSTALLAVNAAYTAPELLPSMEVDEFTEEDGDPSEPPFSLDEQFTK